VAQFDLDGNGSFETSVEIGWDGVLTAVLDLSLLPPGGNIPYRILSGGTPITPRLFLVATSVGPDGPSRTVPVNSLPGSIPG
jgi:hypothetical protein